MNQEQIDALCDAANTLVEVYSLNRPAYGVDGCIVGINTKTMSITVMYEKKKPSIPSRYKGFLVVLEKIGKWGPA